MNGLEGLPKASIEERLHQLQKVGDWLTFMDIYRLLVYDMVLFSQIEDHIDLVAIDAFLAKRDKGENPIIAVLANTYYTLDYYHERNERGLRCCTSLLPSLEKDQNGDLKVAEPYQAIKPGTNADMNGPD
ncbi:hypothetical protein CR513_52974, partial [Mucuna pruriens]